MSVSPNHGVSAGAVVRIADEGTELPFKRKINFVGAGVTATENGDAIDVTIEGGDLSTATGTLGVDHGGTGSTSGTSSGVLYYSDATTITSGSNLTYVATSGDGGVGPQLAVGSGTGNLVGLKIGNAQSGYGAISGIGTSLANNTYAIKIQHNNGLMQLNAGSEIQILTNNTQKIDIQSTAGQGPDITSGTATTDVAALNITRTNNNAAVATGVKIAFTDTNSASTFKALQLLGGAAGTTNLFSVDKYGNLNGNSLTVTGNVAFSGTGTAPDCGVYSTDGNNIALRVDYGAGSFNALTVDSSLATFGVNINADGAAINLNAASSIRSNATNSVSFGNPQVSTAAGEKTVRTEINKAIINIADNTATAAFTVTVPNAAHSASIRVRLTGSSGAGGSVGANESTQDAEYMINVARTAGVNAVATIGAVVGQATAATVAGGNAVAVTGALSAISGAVGAENTFTINVTIARAGGTATNHSCFAFAEILNANYTGVTIA